MTENLHDVTGRPVSPLEAYRYAAAVLEANQIQQAERHGVAYELGWAAAIDFLQQREVPLTPDELARILYTDHAGIQRLISNGEAFGPTAELKRARIYRDFCPDCVVKANAMKEPDRIIPPMRLDELEQICRDSRAADSGETADGPTVARGGQQWPTLAKPPSVPGGCPRCGALDGPHLFRDCAGES